MVNFAKSTVTRLRFLVLLQPQGLSQEEMSRCFQMFCASSSEALRTIDAEET